MVHELVGFIRADEQRITLLYERHRDAVLVHADELLLLDELEEKRK